MKNKILFSILSILGIASIIGLSLIPKEESHLPTTQGISLAASTPNSQKINLARNYETSETEFDFQGLHYIKNTISYGSGYSSITYTVSSVSNPEEVEVITLFPYFNTYEVKYTDLDLSEYTSLTKVVLLGAYNKNAQEILSTIPQTFDLYAEADALGTTYSKDAKVKNYYLCTPYQRSYENYHATSVKESLQASSVEKVYYFDYNESWLKSDMDYMNNHEDMYTNKNSIPMKTYKISEDDIPFDKELFYPYEDFQLKGSYLGCESYAYYDYTFDHRNPSSYMKYKISMVDSKLDTLLISDQISGQCLQNKTFKNLVILHPTDYAFLNCM
ncbi:MAG: hypothetical protein K2N65_02045, partial [Anaeroplasmataceae bacterium]|nr:hypothetical protein [Anaeroplasmataceae bacterium]